jgi:hypothetical protein
MRHCPVTGELLNCCECGACDDLDFDATTGSLEGDPGEGLGGDGL